MMPGSITSGAIARLQTALENGGDSFSQPVRDTLHNVALTAELPTSSEELAVARYVNTLPEPKRTIFLSRRKGMTPQEISKSMNLERAAVCRALAQTYADLRTGDDLIREPSD